MLLFKQKTAYEVRISDWSSDVCSSDLRVRQARLTRKGKAEFAALDRGSRALASRLLDPLGPSQRERLVKAMAEVERLLRASEVEVGVADPASPEARACRSEEHTSELQSLMRISYAVFCLKKKNNNKTAQRL